jgi:hypothetical protein
MPYISQTKEKVKKIDLSNATSLAAGTQETDFYTVPEGKSWIFLNWGIDVAPPTGATTGTHEANIRFWGTETSLTTTIYSATYSASLVVERDDIRDLGLPAGAQISLRYYNGTDVATTLDRDWLVLYIEKEE